MPTTPWGWGPIEEQWRRTQDLQAGREAMAEAKAMAEAHGRSRSTLRYTSGGYSPRSSETSSSED